MRAATIATSRTRATADHLIDYRPLPAAWGDRTALQEVRTAKARAAERGLDPSTLEVAAPPERHARPATLPRRSHRGVLAPLLTYVLTPRLASGLREPGVHHRPRHGRGRLATT